jgi:hypothetical protein
MGAAKDLNRREFEAKLRKLGFRQTSRLGVWTMPRPFSTVRVNERPVGAVDAPVALRVRLAWMLGELDRVIAAKLAGGDK